ncbi:MAG: hypothetical protein ACFBSC_03085 [Microcoleaceae cyanobacterium]
MMKKLLTYTAAAVLGLGLTPYFQAPSYSVSANDIVCQFRYKMGDDLGGLASASGTTRARAKRQRREVIEQLEAKAERQGKTLDVVYMGCEDPWGNGD